MSEINDGGPAFPIEATATPYAPGMSLRAWFAGQALPAAINVAMILPTSDVSPIPRAARMACEAADALIAELERGR